MKKIIIAFVALAYPTICFAQNELELLELPALESQLASKSVLVNMTKHDDRYIAVGERGHIVDWKTTDQWTQFAVPVSVTMTDITTLKNGNLIAVGHDAAILLFKQDTKEWQKVFDGYSLTKLIVSSLEQQIAKQELRLEDLPSDANQYDEEYYLEDLQFALEDAQNELKAGPNKPLLSVVSANNGDIFATGAYGTLLLSKDNGNSWELISSRIDNVDKFHLNDISMDASGNLFIVGENSVAARSTNNGESWQRMDLPYHGSFFGVATSPTSNHVVAFGLQGHIAVSKNSGEDWELLDKKLSISFLGGVINESGIAYLVGHGGLVITFPVSNPTKQSIYKHPSGATFAAVMLEGDKQLVLAGQLGINRWTIGK